MHTHSYPVLVFVATSDVASALAVLTSQVQPPAHPPPSIGHDPQPSLDDSSHDSNVGAMPQQLAVVQLAVLSKAAASAGLSTRHRLSSSWPPPVACMLTQC